MPRKDDDAPLWERLEGEPALWFDRFTTYRLLGPNRGLLRAARADSAKHSQDKTKTVNSVSGAWQRAAARWRWEERAQAWDEDVRRREEARWERRRKRQRELEWKTAQDLLAKGKQMLAWPLARQEKKDEDGRQVTVVTPARWGMRDSASFFETGSKLARLAADMVTSKDQHEVTGKDGTPLEIRRAFDLEKLSDDELAALLANLRALSDGDGGASVSGATPAADGRRGPADMDDETSGDVVAKDAV